MSVEECGSRITIFPYKHHMSCSISFGYWSLCIGFSSRVYIWSLSPGSPIERSRAWLKVSEYSTGQQIYKQRRGRMLAWKADIVVRNYEKCVGLWLPCPISTMLFLISVPASQLTETNSETVQLYIVFLIRLLSLVSVAFVSPFVLS